VRACSGRVAALTITIAGRMRTSFPSWAGRLCVAVLLASSLGQEAPARTRIVDCAGGSDHEHCGWSEAPCGTIQRALDRSSNGDRVEVKRGVCKGPGNMDLRFRGLEVELVGREWTPDSGPAVEISCGGAGRAFKFEHNEGTRTKISGFLVRDCQAGYGGAVWCENASPLFERVVFSDNKAGYAGGGVYWVTRGPVLRDVEFVRNSAGSYGPDTASTFTTLDLPGFPLADYTPGAPFPGHGVQARLLDPYGQIVSTAYDIKMAIRLIFSDEAGGTGGGGVAKSKMKNAGIVQAAQLATAKGLSPGQLMGQLKSRFPNLSPVWNDATGYTDGALTVIDTPPLPRLEGNVEVPVVAGVAHWSDIRMFAKPGTQITMVVSQEEEEVESFLRVSVRKCRLGEEELALECRECPAGWVSTVLGTPCQPCRRGSICAGGHALQVLPGFYLESTMPVVVTECPDVTKCLGGATSTCAIGYSGLLCQSCTSGRRHQFSKVLLEWLYIVNVLGH